MVREHILDLPPTQDASQSLPGFFFFVWGSECTFMCDCCWVGDRSKIYYVPFMYLSTDAELNCHQQYGFLIPSPRFESSLYISKENDSWVHANKKILPPNIFLSLQWKTTGAYPVITNIASEKSAIPKTNSSSNHWKFFSGKLIGFISGRGPPQLSGNILILRNTQIGSTTANEDAILNKLKVSSLGFFK